jgi:hypothetical protein
LKITRFSLNLGEFDSVALAFSEEKNSFKCLQFFFSASDVYPSNTETLLEAQNSPETEGVQRLTLENTSI